MIQGVHDNVDTQRHKAINQVFQPYELKAKAEIAIHNTPRALSAITEEQSFDNVTHWHMAINYEAATIITAIICHLAHINSKLNVT